MDRVMLALRRVALSIAATSLLLLQAGCGGGSAGTDTASPAQPLAAGKRGAAAGLPTVVSLTKVNETRISRTVYDYVFKVTIQNGPTPKTAIIATATGAGQGTTVLDGSVLVGDIAAGATVTPSDTITLRVDRAFVFSVTALVWQITEPINGIAVPPEPDPAKNAATVGGVDSNQNGIRDDVERKIAADFGSIPTEYAVAFAHGKSIQAAILVTNQSNSTKHVQLLVCADRSLLMRLRGVTLATLDIPSRQLAYGDAFAGSLISDEGCVK